MTSTYSPRDFLRRRRPDEFSDTVDEKQPVLEKAVFEYHLESLTKRKQEAAFEYFAHRLAEREICPNLLPQTGPTGGGDSKTDGSTYRVAPSLHYRWLLGAPKPTDEYWVFAFSAKKKWSSKVRDDVANLLQNERRPDEVYFLTSQYVSDRMRQKIIDEVRQKHDISLNILDRTWIIKQVFERGHDDIAIEALDIEVEGRAGRRIGPEDYRRRGELDELIARLDKPETYAGHTYSMVEDYLAAARLSRELDDPRHQTEGLLSRARELAREVAVDHQQVRVAYATVWTAYFYHDDFALAARLYVDVERAVDRSSRAEDFGKLHTLWILLFTVVRTGDLEASKAELADRYKWLQKNLRRLARQKSRPGNSLQAKVDLWFLVRFREAMAGSRMRSGEMSRLQQLLRESKGLIIFPFDRYVNILIGAAEWFEEQTGYDELFREIQELSHERSGSKLQGQQWFRRGMRALSENPRTAVRCLAFARELLHKKETLSAVIRSSIGMAMAYLRLEMGWAARVEAGYAFWLAMEQSEGKPDLMAIYATLLMAEAEVGCGRVTHFLIWIQMTRLLLGACELTDRQRESHVARYRRLDGYAARAFVRLEPSELTQLAGLAPVLDEQELLLARSTLLFCAGATEELAAEGTDPEALEKSMVAGLSASGTADLPVFRPAPAAQGSLVVYDCKVLGSAVNLTFHYSEERRVLAESVLASLQALVASGARRIISPSAATVQIEIVEEEDSTTDDAPCIRVQTTPRGVLWRLSVGADFKRWIKDQEALGEWLRSFVAKVVGRVMMLLGDLDDLEQLVVKSGALARLGVIGTNAAATSYVVKAPETVLDGWRRDTSLVCTRQTRWLDEQAFQDSDAMPPRDPIPPSDEEWETMPTVSITDPVLWSQAQWRGMCFLTVGDEVTGLPMIGAAPPLIAFVFGSIAHGLQIFEQWRHAIGGDTDTDNRIRLALIKEAAGPDTYAVHVCPQPVPGDNGWVAALSRIHVMDSAPGLPNLERFLLDYARAQRYRLAVATYDGGELRFCNELAILKTDLIVRSVDEIGQHDIDSVVLGHERSRATTR